MSVSGQARVLLVAFVVMAVSLSCGGNAGSPAATSTAPSTIRGGGQTPAVATTATGGDGRTADEPVAFQTPDGVTIKGHLYTAPGPKRQAVILAHMYPNDQRVWRDFARELAGQGIAALTFDFRGYGETGGAKDVTKIDRDLASALLFVKARDYPLIYLVGASMGGTAALKVAAGQDVAGLVTVSAPLSFMGLDAQADVARIRAKKLFLASRNEPEGGGTAAEQLMQLAVEPKELFIFEGSAHGTELLQGANAAAFKQKVTDFLK